MKIARSFAEASRRTELKPSVLPLFAVIRSRLARAGGKDRPDHRLQPERIADGDHKLADVQPF